MCDVVLPLIEHGDEEHQVVNLCPLKDRRVHHMVVLVVKSLRELVNVPQELLDDLLLLLSEKLDLDGFLVVGLGEHELQRFDLRPEHVYSVSSGPLQELVDLALELVDDFLLLLGDELDLDGLLVVGRGEHDGLLVVGRGEHELQRVDLRPELVDSVGRGPLRDLVVFNRHAAVRVEAVNVHLQFGFK